jgi:hypothetical protein
MPLNCELGNWDKYIRKYRSSDTQWYLIPKAKTYSDESIRLLIQGLNLLNYWFSEPELLPEKEKTYLESYLQHPQQKLFSESFVFRWGAPAQVFFASKLFIEGIISREQQSENLKAKFDEIIQVVEGGKNYYEIERKFGKDLLINWFSANSRNSINIYQRLGLAWVEENHLVTTTSVGKRLIENNIDYRPVLEHQLRKLQYYNPTFERIKERYGHIKVFPFNFCLQLIMDLQPCEITKQEFALFVTKATTMEDIAKCVAWINKFRQLDDKQRNDIIEKLTSRQKGRLRPVFVESLETASKNINFLTLSGPWNRSTVGNSEGIILRDVEKAKNILAEDKELQFVEFDSKESWFCYYGDILRKFDIEGAIDYYTRIGKWDKAKELTKKIPNIKEVEKKLQQRLEEKHIEDFYRDHLDLIEPGLKLYKKHNRMGQQFETPDGGIIDLLTISTDGTFVVIEFKRDETSDETIGQVLRYMGWVRKNLSSDKIVRSYIVARDFDKYITYALYGMQHPLIPNAKGNDLIQRYKHTFDVSKMGVVCLDILRSN